MQLTRFTDYSLRVLMYLGGQFDHLVTIKEIARKHNVSKNHLMKVVHGLATYGYIVTVRGRGGGMRLSRRPEKINLGDVVRDTEENMNIAECFGVDAQSCTLLPACVLKSVLTEARKNFLATLNMYQLSDLIHAQMEAGALTQVASPATARKSASR